MVASAAGSEARAAVSPLISPVGRTSGSAALGHAAQLAGSPAAVDAHAIAAAGNTVSHGGAAKITACLPGVLRGRGPRRSQAPSPPDAPSIGWRLSMVAQPQRVRRTQPLHPKLKRRAATDSKTGVSQPRRRRGRDDDADSKPALGRALGLRIHGARKPCFAAGARDAALGAIEGAAASRAERPEAHRSTALLSPNISLRKKPPLSERVRA